MKDLKRVPKLRFKEFSDVWNLFRMDDMFTIKAGGDIKSNNVSKSKTDSFIYPIYANAEKDKGFYGYSDIYKIQGETLTIAGRGVNIGIAHARNEKYYPIVRLLTLIPINDENVKFFEYQFNRQNILIESTGVPQLTAPQVSSYKLFKTVLSEQQKIATFLSSVDKKIDLLQQKKSLLEQYKKGVMQQLFSQQLRFKDENGKTYPDWEEKEIIQIFKDYKGKGIPKGDVTEEGEKKCVLYGELYTQYNEVIYDVVSKTDSNEGLASKKGDLLIPSSTTTTGIDLANVTALNDDNILLGGDIIVLRAKKELNSVFYAYYLSNHKKNEIAKRAQGITIIHLYFSSIKDLKVDFPCIEEQTKIANFLSGMDKKIELVNTQIENTKAFKKGLLQQMFV